MCVSDFLCLSGCFTKLSVSFADAFSFINDMLSNLESGDLLLVTLIDGKCVRKFKIKLASAFFFFLSLIEKRVNFQIARYLLRLQIITWVPYERQLFCITRMIDCVNEKKNLLIFKWSWMTSNLLERKKMAIDFESTFSIELSLRDIEMWIVIVISFIWLFQIEKWPRTLHSEKSLLRTVSG